MWNVPKDLTYLDVQILQALEKKCSKTLELKQELARMATVRYQQNKMSKNDYESVAV